MIALIHITQLPLSFSLQKKIFIVTHGFSYGERIHDLANAKITQLVGAFPILKRSIGKNCLLWFGKHAVWS